MLRTCLLCTLLLSAPLSAMDIAHTTRPIIVDGVPEQTWDQAQWQPMPYLMAGTQAKPDDFFGRFKLLWDEQYLYLQAQITDDILFDKSPNPLVAYWDDDCLEIFIDSDASGGDHQYNHSAFAYHIALDNQTVDLGDDQQAHLYNDHLTSRWQRDSQDFQKITWEVAIKLFPDSYTDSRPLPAITLKPGQKIGFMLAYCDNDGSKTREHFMGSHEIQPLDGDTNRGWIDASVFGQMSLKK